MYLFQQIKLKKMSLIKIIYIPLCIYFNSPGCIVQEHVRTYLHSTMYLFQPAQRDEVAPVMRYLHSTMYLFQPQIFRSLISIRIIVALLSTKQTSIIFILTCSGNIWIITDKIRIVDLPVILQYYVPTVKA